MSWTNNLKLTLESNTVVAGLQAIMTTAGKASAAVGSVGTAAASAGAAAAGGFTRFTDVLWKLPDQVRALQGVLSTLSLPSELAGRAETTRVAFSVLVGSAEKADAVLSRIQTLAASTPFEFPELTDAARKLAAFGENADSIPDTLRRIGDIASGTETRIADLAEIYGKARVQGTLFAEDINQLTGRGIPVLQQFASILGVTTAEVKQMASEGQITFPMLEQAFKNLTTEGGQFSGMMGKISETFEGKMSTLSDGMKTLLTKLGAGVNEGLKPVFDELTSALAGQEGLAESLGQKIGYSIEVGLEMLKRGDLGDVLTTQLKAGALEFSALIMQGVDMAVNWLVDQLDEKVGEYTDLLPGGDARKINRISKKALRDAGTSNDELGIDSLNEKARVAREEADAKLDESSNVVDTRKRARRFEEENTAGRDAYFKRQADEEAANQKRQAEEEAAKKGQADAVANYAADTAAGPVEARKGVSGPMWYDTPSDKASAVDKAAAEKAAVDADYERLYGKSPAPAGEAPGDGGPGMPGYNGPSKADEMAARINAAGSGGGGDATGGRRRIQGAVMPGSFQYKNGVKVPYDGGAAGGADRMAAMGNGQSRAAQAEQAGADMALKAATLVVKLLPDIARNLQQNAKAA